MSTGQTGPGPEAGSQPTEEELRAAYEAEIKNIRVEQVVLEQIVTLINLGMRRTGLAPGSEDERDLAQVRLAIESVRLQLPLLEQSGAPQTGQIRDALSQLQLAYVRIGGQAQPGQEPPASPAGPPAQTPAAAGEPSPEPAPAEPQPGEAGPAQRSGRLWIPGQ